MEEVSLEIEKKDRVGVLTFNRPEKRNALTPEMLITLHQVLTTWAAEESVRAVILRGAGEVAFSSGFDIGAIPAGADPAKQEMRKDPPPLELALQSVIQFPYPVIAFLNGYAFGAGCELAICCDLRVGVENIRMGMPPAKLGLVYPPNGLILFVQAVGFPKTREIFLTGRYFSATRAREMGLVDYLFPRQEAEAFVWEMAREIAGNAPLAVKGMKRILNLLTQSLTLSEEARREAHRLIAAALNSRDLKEAQAAFLQKRKPEFQGK